MTSPSPDADLDTVLGLDALPPAAVTDGHIYRADCAMYELPLATDVPAEDLRDAIAQLLADAEQRGAARVLFERGLAGIPDERDTETCPTCEQPVSAALADRLGPPSCGCGGEHWTCPRPDRDDDYTDAAVDRLSWNTGDVTITPPPTGGNQ